MLLDCFKDAWSYEYLPSDGTVQILGFGFASLAKLLKFFVTCLVW